MSPAELVEAMRVRIVRDPGDELLIDGKPTRVRWPPSFFRVGPGLFAEVVVDFPTAIQSFPAELWTGPLDDLLNAAWRKTLNRIEYQIGEIEVESLKEPLLAVTGEVPYVTAYALAPWGVLKEPGSPDAFAALVAVPAPDCVIVHLFKDASLSGKDEIGAVMRAVARQHFEACEEQKRVSPDVFLTRASDGFRFEAVA